MFSARSARRPGWLIAITLSGAALLSGNIANAQMCQRGGGPTGGGGRVGGGPALGGGGGGAIGQMMQVAQMAQQMQQAQAMQQLAALNAARQQDQMRQLMLARQLDTDRTGENARVVIKSSTSNRPAMSRRERLRALIAERRREQETQGLSRRQRTLQRSARLRAEREAAALAASTVPSTPVFPAQ